MHARSEEQQLQLSQKKPNFHAEESISSSQPHYTRPDVVTCEIERTHFKLSVYM